MSVVSKRRKEMVLWAASNFDEWPTDTLVAGVSLSDIGCRLTWNSEVSSLPVLECCRGGGCVSSTDYFYAKIRNNKAP